MTLTLTTAGESHGPGLVAIVEGLPAGLELDRESIQHDLWRRQQGYGRSPRQQIETDRLEVLAGLRQGKTLGTPLALHVPNRDHKNWTWGMSPWQPEGEPAGKGTKAVTLPRPGHADLPGGLKYDHDDVRNSLGRASARPTAGFRAAGGGATAPPPGPRVPGGGGAGRGGTRRSASRPAASRRLSSRRSGSPSEARSSSSAARRSSRRCTPPWMPHARTATRSAGRSRCARPAVRRGSAPTP